jgi:uncharacterized protein YjbI with pentapeptide repeats
MDIESLLAKGRSKTAKPPQKLKKNQASSSDLAETAKAESAIASSDKSELLSVVSKKDGEVLSVREDLYSPVASLDVRTGSHTDSASVPMQDDLIPSKDTESTTVEKASFVSEKADTANAVSAIAENAIAVLANAVSAVSELANAISAKDDIEKAEPAIAAIANAVTETADIANADTAIAKSTIADSAIAKPTIAGLALAEIANADTSNADTSNADTSNADTSNADTSNADTSNADTAIAKSTTAGLAIAETAKADSENEEAGKFSKSIAESANAKVAIATTATYDAPKSTSTLLTVSSTEDANFSNAESLKVISTGVKSTRSEALDGGENSSLQNSLLNASDTDKEFVSRVVSYLASSEFGLREIRIALYLLGRTIREGRGWLLYSNQEIEQGTKCHFTHVSTSMTSLEKYGFIERTHPKRTAEKKSFRIVWP